MTFFEQELRNMFDCTDVIQNPVFVGKTMLGKLDEKLRVKLQFTTVGVRDEYPAIQATILNRTEGIVDKETFIFSDIIGMRESQFGSKTPHIWVDNGKAKWYMPISVEQKAEIADTILSYVELYQSEELVLYGQSM